MRPIDPSLSVIIPTYNRKDSLLRTLDSLCNQTFPADRFEVIVVDDGSIDATREVADLSFPFSFEYICHTNRGDALSRNAGAMVARGECLLFIDDDITLDENCLAAFFSEYQAHQHAIIVGNLIPVVPKPEQPFHHHLSRAFPNGTVSNHGRIPFTACLSGFMAINSVNFQSVGMMQRLGDSGADAWCDVDLAYRADQSGFEFYMSQTAIGYHYDNSIRTFTDFCRRSERVGRSAVMLFKKHPTLRDLIPMFRDKLPISLPDDDPSLLMRKLLRRIASSPPAVFVMQQLRRILERIWSKSPLLPLLYRWITSAHIYQGFQSGLKFMGDEKK